MDKGKLFEEEIAVKLLWMQ